MAKSVCEVLLTELPLEPPAQTSPEETGAIVDFWGVVRRTEDGSPITGIEYEAHQAMAEHQLRIIAQQAAERFKLGHVSIRHRTGFVPVGEASLLVRVASRHRAAGYRSSEWIVEELKKRAPIWKHPVFQPTARRARPALAQETEAASSQSL